MDLKDVIAPQELREYKLETLNFPIHNAVLVDIHLAECIPSAEIQKDSIAIVVNEDIVSLDITPKNP